MGRGERRPTTVIDLAVVAAVTVGIGIASGALRGFPKGYDALGHLAKVRLLLAAWPHLNWNDSWYGGLPNFTGSYPPGYHLLVAAFSFCFRISIESAMLVVTGLSFVLVTTGSYALVRLVTRSRYAAWIATLALIAEPTLWDQSLQLGLYPRLLSLGFGAAGAAAAAGYGRTRSRWWSLAMVLSLGASLSAHPVVGVMCTVFAAAVIWA
ncbi:MAG TPA: DUF6541 family protein, partial [Acidimicrobiales bacterium]|nr:DUF6541 family protein [Acidimicrobiales bacterium]